MPVGDILIKSRCVWGGVGVGVGAMSRLAEPQFTYQMPWLNHAEDSGQLFSF